jgi:hypothetical protein
VTDGEHVFAFFGSHGLYCLDMNGEMKWEKQFGAMQTKLLRAVQNGGAGRPNLVALVG